MPNSPYINSLQYGLDQIKAYDLWAILVMENSTALGELDLVNPADFSTLDEYDGSGYARVQLTGCAVSTDNALFRAVLTCDPITFPSLGIGTRQCIGMVIIKKVTNDADSLNIAAIDTASGDTTWPFDGTGVDVNIVPDPDLGLLIETTVTGIEL